MNRQNKNRVTLNSVYENDLNVHIGDMIVNGIYLSHPDKKFFRKLDEENKRVIIDRINNYQTLGETQRVLANSRSRDN